MQTNRPPYIDQLRAETRGLPYRPAKQGTRTKRERPSPEDSHRLFTVERGNRWMDLAGREPEAKMLFGELWHQGELCMLFAGTNIGKSVLAVQIGESIARRKRIAGFACQVPAARVLYIDFELSKTQFGLRYRSNGRDYLFSDNFFRAEYNFINDAPDNVDENDLLIAAIEYKVQLVKATVLIIDNITCLRGGTENAIIALSLMKSLKALKTGYNLSILVLAHTPKRRNALQPIGDDDLHGSKLLMNFADSAFTIGKSTADSSLCYLKQIKQRNTSQRYGESNVCLCRIQKPGTFLHFKFSGHGPEHRHLIPANRYGLHRPIPVTREELPEKIARLATAGLSQRDIGKQLNIGLGTVNRWIRKAGIVADRPIQVSEAKKSNLTISPTGKRREKLVNQITTQQSPTEAEGYCSNSLPGEGREGLTNHAIIRQTTTNAEVPYERDSNSIHCTDMKINELDAASSSLQRREGASGEAKTGVSQPACREGLTNQNAEPPDEQFITSIVNPDYEAFMDDLITRLQHPEPPNGNKKTKIPSINPNPTPGENTYIINIPLSPFIKDDKEPTPRTNPIPAPGGDYNNKPYHPANAKENGAGP